jgi:uncharacterized membrane protein YphA (DoxX/SURF4 family)
MHSTKTQKIAYWTTTGLIAFAMGAGGIPDLIQAPDAVTFIGRLGYPAYFASIIGVWKVLGAVALVVPQFPRLKEWAYAGIIFDLTGAAVSQGVSGGGAVNVILPLVLAAITLASWALRPQSRRLGVIAPNVTTSAAPALSQPVAPL